MLNLFKEKEQLKILFVSSEAAPYARIGGLGSVMHALPRALRAIGHDARVMIPAYIGIDKEKYKLKYEIKKLQVPTDNELEPKYLTCNVKSYNVDTTDTNNKDLPPTYFLENKEYYEQRANIYGYSDDSVRWALLSRGTLEFLKIHNGWIPDVIVATDWQTGFLLNYLKTVYKRDPKLSKIAGVFSIHNIAHQGTFDYHFVQEMDVDDGHSPIPGFNDPRLANLNGMRRGIMYADIINTVSPTYAKEIMTKEYGQTQDDLLRERRDVLFGILNGIDYDLWNPEKDPYITHPFSISTLEKRAANKLVLQDRFGLEKDKSAFVAGIVTRFTWQKGFDLLKPIMEVLLKELNMQFVMVGEGDADNMRFFHDLEVQNPGRVAAHLKFSNVLPHVVFAGADITLVPSRFEPSGLTQMEAMRLGTIPVVRNTGGLSDTVKDYTASTKKPTGFVFEKVDPLSLLTAITRAYGVYHSGREWHVLQKNAMEKDFSWEHSAKEYEKLFKNAIKYHSRNE